MATYNINKEITPKNGSEVKSEVKNGKSEVKNEKSEVKNGESEVKNEVKSEVKNEESEVKNEESEVKSEVKNGKSEVKSEVKIQTEILTNSEKEVLSLIKQNTQITYEQIGKSLSLGVTTIYKIVKCLKKKELIHREGSSAHGYWVINNESVDLAHIDMPAPPRRRSRKL